MKKFKLILGIICLILLISSSLNLSRDYYNGNLYYDGQTKSFTYYNVDKKDLFNSFKELMPGDKRTQKIIISTYNMKKETKMFLTIKINNNNKKLFSNIDLNIYKNDKIIYKGKLNDKIKDNILLNNFKSNEQIELIVEIDVPTTIGNEIINQTLNMDFQFLIQEKNENIIKPTKTYDNSRIVFDLFLMIIPLIIIIILIVTNKKSKKEK